MKPKWLISSNCYTDGNPEKLRDAVIKQGCEVDWFKYIPFMHDKERTWKFAHNDCVVSYGSIQLSRLVQRTTAWVPGPWAEWDNITTAVCLLHWGKFSIHQHYCFMPLGLIPLHKNNLFSFYGAYDGQGMSLFIRPDDNAKSFNGELVCDEKYDEWWKYVTVYEPPLKTMALISQPSKIKREWRLIISDKQVVTGSRYKLNGMVEIEAGYPAEVAKYAEEVTHTGTYEPAPVYCMDIAELDTGDLRLIEFGSINSCGLYDCDAEIVVEHVNAAAAREWESLS